MNICLFECIIESRVLSLNFLLPSRSRYRWQWRHSCRSVYVHMQPRSQSMHAKINTDAVRQTRFRYSCTIECVFFLLFNLYPFICCLKRRSSVNHEIKSVKKIDKDVTIFFSSHQSNCKHELSLFIVRVHNMV